MRAERDRILPDYLLLYVCIIHLLMIELINFTKSYEILDYDSGLAIRHAVDMWRNGTIFLKDFVYTTSMEIDCPGFFAAPLYILTNNLNVSMGIAHILFDGLLVYGIFMLLRNLGVEKKWRYIAILLVMTLWDFGQVSWDNMIFLSDGQYEFRMLAVIYPLINLTYSDDNIRKAERIYVGILSCCFPFIVSLSMGNYLLMVFGVPLVLAVGVRFAGSKMTRIREVIWVGAYIFSMIIALLIRLIVGVNTNKTNLNMVKIDQFSDNVGAVFAAIFRTFGAATTEDISVISLDGFLRLIKFIFVLILIGLFVYGIAKHEIDERNDFFVKSTVFMVFVNFVVFTFANTQYIEGTFECRYHILWTFVVILFDVVVLSKKDSLMNKKQKLLIYGLIIVALLIINVFAGTKLIKLKTKSSKIRNTISSAVSTNGVDSVVFWDDILAPAYSALDFRVNVISAKMVDETNIGRSVWGTFANVEISERNLLVVKTDRIEEIPSEIMSNYDEIDEYKGYTLYITDSYKWE